MHASFVLILLSIYRIRKTHKQLIFFRTYSERSEFRAKEKNENVRRVSVMSISRNLKKKSVVRLKESQFYFVLDEGNEVLEIDSRPWRVVVLRLKIEQRSAINTEQMLHFYLLPAYSVEILPVID